MKSFLFILTLGIMICFLLSMIFYYLQTKQKDTQDEKSAFECGFLSLDKTQKSFSISYFYMTIIFLIFDLEILILMPMVIFKSSSYTWSMLLIITIYFTLVLTMEWSNNMLEWNL